MNGKAGRLLEHPSFAEHFQSCTYILSAFYSVKYSLVICELYSPVMYCKKKKKCAENILSITLEIKLMYSSIALSFNVPNYSIKRSKA